MTLDVPGGLAKNRPFGSSGGQYSPGRVSLNSNTSSIAYLPSTQASAWSSNL